MLAKFEQVNLQERDFKEVVSVNKTTILEQNLKK